MELSIKEKVTPRKNSETIYYQKKKGFATGERASKDEITQIIFGTTTKVKDQSAQKIIESKTGEKTFKARDSTVSSCYQYNIKQTIPTVMNEIWTFNDMKNALPSTYQHKMDRIISPVNTTNREKVSVSSCCQSVIPQQISAKNTRNWNVKDWGSIGSYCLQSNIEQKKIPAENVTKCNLFRWITPSKQEMVKKNIEKIIDIARRLLYKKRYIVCGNWVCQDDVSSLHYIKDNVWRKIFPRNSLIKLLEKSPEVQYEFFRETCNQCDKKKQITSFSLHTSLRNLNGAPSFEVICHLVWNKHYRVFGHWKCLNCQNKWVSAYTWMSLQKFIDQTSGDDLKWVDFYMQNCKKCGMNKSTICRYEPLALSEDGGTHKQHLCAKCKHGERCTQTGTYFGHR